MGQNQSGKGGSQIKGDLHPVERDQIVEKIKKRVDNATAEERALAKELGGVYLFNIIKGRMVESWTMNLDSLEVYEGEPPDDPDAIFTLTEYNFKQLALGKEDPRLVLAAGRCSVTGDIMRAMRLEPYINLEKPISKAGKSKGIIPRLG